MAWNVQEYSNIRKLPKVVWPAALIARNVRDLFRKPAFEADGITSLHLTEFKEKAEFRRAYARAVQAGGWDFNIPFRVHQALWCSRVAQKVQGVFVELGTGRGFMMSALLEDGLDRPVHLFDTFLSKWVNAEGAQDGRESPYYASSFEQVEANFNEWPNVRLHCGDVFETLPAAQLASVAFAHIDMNHPDPEEFGFRYLWPLMPSGGVVLFDDYAFMGCERQNERINDLATEFGFSVLTTPSGQGIVIK